MKRLGELGLHSCESGLARMQAARDVDAENLEAGSRFPALGARDDAKNSIGWRSTASTLEQRERYSERMEQNEKGKKREGEGDGT